MITLEIYQGSGFTRVVQPKDRSGNPPLYFLLEDTLSAAVWNGQTQQVLFNPTVEWFTGLAEVSVTAGGSGYSSTPTITITGGGAANDATAQATVISGVIAEITVASPGSGYTGAPVITITDSSGTGATATGTPSLGWKTGQVLIEMTSAQTTDLDTMGQYRFRATVARGTELTALIDCLLRVYPSAGTSTRLTTTYCSYQDMLDLAPWIAGVQDVDTDQEGFYSQRLKARLWLDNIILNRYQGGGYTGSFGAHSNDFGNWSGQAIGSDRYMAGYLTADKLMRTPAVVEVCARYAVACIGLAQVGAGGGMSLAKWGSYHMEKANLDVKCITAEIDTDDDGLCDIPVNLSTIATVYG